MEKVLVSNVVNVIKGGITVIGKYDSESPNITVTAPYAVVLRHENAIVVTSSVLNPFNNNPHIALVKDMSGSDDKEILKEYRKVVGKLIEKDSSSKYFSNPRYDEHFKNGNPGCLKEEDVLDTCVFALDQIGFKL